MNLYQIKLTSVFPGETEQEALRRFNDEQEIYSIQESDFNIVIPKDDYAKIFKFARTLYEVVPFAEVNVSELVSAYVRKLGYELSDDDISEGVLKWVERLSEYDEDELENWLN